MESIVDKVRVKAVPTSSHLNCEHDWTHSQFLFENRDNFKRSGQPDRFMYYEEGSWIDFSGDVLDSLRSGFLERKAMIEVEIGGSKCLFDFYRMLLINLDSGDQKSVSWIDVNGKCFFPKTFIGTENFSENLSYEASQEIQIDVRVIEKKSSSSKRKRDGVKSESDSSSSNDQSKKLQLLVSDLESTRWPKAKLLKEGEQVYTTVKRLFLSGLRFVEPGGAEITAIHQCNRTGPLDKARFEVFNKQLEMTKAARGREANVTFAWYGTSAKGVESILSYGFSFVSEISAAEAHGIGIYLSPARSSSNVSAMLSEVDDNGEKHAIFCRVILGKCEKVEAGSQQSYPSSVNFDTGVDDVKNPKWYVVWCANMNTHILPECVVSYRSSNRTQGQLKGLSMPEWMSNASDSFTAKLLSKLGSSLPSSKVRDLQALWGTFKDGKLAKDTFVQRLRLIAGEERLHSILREIRG